MADLVQSAWRLWLSPGIVLLCILGLRPVRAAVIDIEPQLPKLGAKQASRLLLSQAVPDYPVLAKVNYIQGRVRVQLVVDTEGKIASAHVLSGNPLLAAAVLYSVPGWRYQPYVAQGRPTAFETMVEVTFALRANRQDLMPAQAESDFRRQVKPPELLTGPGATSASNPSVRMRLLVSAEGKVLDLQILKGIPSMFEKATKVIRRWSFQPARWGTLAVPWYLDVDVPLDNAGAQAGLGSQHGVGRPGTE